MKTLCAITIAGFCLPMVHCSSDSPSSHRATVLVRAERDFAALSVREGMKPAFMEFLADSGVVFRPHPVNGKKATSARPNPAITLDWVPSFADVAAGEDLGYTTGPWIVTDRSGKNRPPAYGTYLSVWKKQVDQEWKVVLDIGTSGPPPPHSLVDVQTEFPEENVTTEIAPHEGPEVLFELDRGFSLVPEASREYLRYAGKHIRLIREGVFPVVGNNSAKFALDEMKEHMAFSPIAGELSRTGDLGYTYGTYERTDERGREKGGETGYYVHIWKREDDSTFHIAVDLLSPVSGE
jgi:ketosteroid isomerase-like protein